MLIENTRTSTFIILLAVAFAFASIGPNHSSISDGLGQVLINSLTHVTADTDGSSTLIPTLIVANLPQLVFALVYLLYDNLFTRMLLAREWLRFGVRRKPLRVTGRRKGAQKSTRMLSLPGKYAIGLMAFASVVHWLISQSIYLVRIDVVDNRGLLDESDTIARLGYSALGIMLVLIMCIIALAVAILFGRFGRFAGVGLPGNGSNSAIISAACHTGFGESGASMGLLMWGAVNYTRDANEYTNVCLEEQSVVGHCTFSCGVVDDLIEGNKYR
jgi:hypothetical protein